MTLNLNLKRWSAGWLLWLALAALLTGLATIPAPTHAALTDLTYFQLTGHYTSGVFKDYWEQNGGLEQFGYPITGVFEEKSTNGQIYVTQYFERAVFEAHLENAGTKYQVLLRLAGRLTTQGRDFAPATIIASTPDTYYFPETKHSLTGAFLTYWQQYGGLSTYGYPLSEPFEELNQADGKTYTVQYFERSRLEYHPEYKGTRYEILQGLLGNQLLKTANVPAISTDPEQADKNIAQIGIPLTIKPLSGPHIGYGMNVWLLGQDQDRVLGLVKNAGFGWVRQQVAWADLEPIQGQFQWDALDQVVNALDRNGIKGIFSIVRSPTWAGIGHTSGLPADPTTFGTLMTEMAKRYKGKVAAYEVWNEQNLSIETGGHITVGPYVETLKAGYRAVKAVDPQAFVLFGGLSPTGINDANAAIDDQLFLEMCYQYNYGEMRNYFDVLGVHPGGAANSPDELWPNDPPADKTKPFISHPSFYFRRVENIRAVMEQYGDATKQTWLTEFGWTTKNLAPGYEYGALISEQTQADYLVRAYQRAKLNYPWMGVMSLWQLNFATIVGPADEKGPWGIIRADWSTRPSYDALKAMTK